MNVQAVMTNVTVDRKNLENKTGAAAAFVLVAGYFMTFPLFGMVGLPPSGIEERMVYFANNAAGWWAILGLMVFTDLLYIPIWFRLYQILKSTNKNLMLLAVTFMGLFVVLDLAVTWTAYGSLIALGSSYVSATSETQRMAIAAASGYPGAVTELPLAKVYAILFPSIGVLLSGMVMSKIDFGQTGIYMSWAVGISGIIAVAGPYLSSLFDSVFLLNALLMMFWFMVIGVKLLRLQEDQ